MNIKLFKKHNVRDFSEYTNKEGKRLAPDICFRGCALDELSKRGFRCIYFDMMRVESVRKFCAAYASSAYALESGTVRAMRTVSKLLSSLRPKFTIGDDGKPASAVYPRQS